MFLNSDMSIDLLSPNYPHHYINNANCTWYVQGPSSNGSTVIDVLDFFTEIYFDYLRVGFGNEVSDSSTLVKITGNQAPNKLILSGEIVVWMNFVSDGDNRKRGFRLQLKWTSVNGNTSFFFLNIIALNRYF